MEYLLDGRVHTFTTFFTVLAWMEPVVINGVVNRTTAKNESDHKVEIGFEEVDDLQFVEVSRAGLLVYHDVCLDRWRGVRLVGYPRHYKEMGEGAGL